MAGFDKAGVQAVKERIDIVDLVREYVDLRSAGGRWTAPCPFHQETKPSFSVNQEQGFYYCFGCRASGDAITFYQEINGLDFREALEQLAERTGVVLSAAKRDPAALKRRQGKQSALEMHKAASDFFRSCLTRGDGEIARSYLSERGVEQRIVERFGLGYSPNDWHQLERYLERKGFSKDAAAWAGLLSKNEKGNIYDRFRGRLMFPIQDMAGRVAAFGARTLTGDDPKYLNSSESDIYIKGDHLYGLFHARRNMSHSRTAILTEGYTDVLSLHQFGFENACGVLGTALTPNQVKRLSGFCSRVDMIFDGDNAGRKAALKAAQMLLSAGLACRAVIMPEGEDVDGLLHKQGAGALRELMDKAPDGIDYCINTIKETLSPKEILDWARKYLNGLQQPSLTGYYIPRLASGLGLAERELRRELEASGAQTTKRRSEEVRCGKQDKELLRFAVNHPEYTPELERRGLSKALTSGFATDFWNKLLTAEGEGMPPGLIDVERAFWAECRMNDGDVLCEPEAHFKDICDWLDKRHDKAGRQSAMEALRKAQSEGDEKEVLRMLQILREQSEPMGRLDEQP